MPERHNSPVTAPDVIISYELGTLTSHPEYERAKSGDTVAAIKLAQCLVTDNVIASISELLPKVDFLLPVLAQEAQGRNKIPLAIAKVLQSKVAIGVELDVYQINRVGRTTLSGLERIFAIPVFEGGELNGKSFLLIDDTLTQGGTFASLASHVEQCGGRVTGCLALTGKQYSARLTIDSEVVARLTHKYGDIENDFVQATGYAFKALTNSEGRYLANFKPSNSVRTRILEERDERFGR